MFINGLFHEDSLAVMRAWMLAIAVSFSGNNSEFDSEIRQYIIHVTTLNLIQYIIEI
jgi:hypothetical protein